MEEILVLKRFWSIREVFAEVFLSGNLFSATISLMMKQIVWERVLIYIKQKKYSEGFSFRSLAFCPFTAQKILH